MKMRPIEFRRIVFRQDIPQVAPRFIWTLKPDPGAVTTNVQSAIHTGPIAYSTASLTRSHIQPLSLWTKKGRHYCRPFYLISAHAQNFNRTCYTHNSNKSGTHPSAPAPGYCTLRRGWRRAGSRWRWWVRTWFRRRPARRSCRWRRLHRRRAFRR